MTDEMAMRLLQVTTEQLYGKPTRDVEPYEIAQKAGLDPYSREYYTRLRYLLDHGYIVCTTRERGRYRARAV